MALTALRLLGTDGAIFYNWELLPGKYTIGRKDECEFKINHKTVSRKHAEIVVSADSTDINLRDLGSHNGTYFNDQKITDSVKIKLGDHIIFGQISFKIVDSDNKALTTPSKTNIIDFDLEKSRVISINEALQPLPDKLTDNPDVMPVIFDLARMLVLQEPQDVMLKKSLDLVARLIPAERLAVLLVEAGCDEPIIVASRNSDGNAVDDFTLSSTIVHEVMTEKNALLVDPSINEQFGKQESIILSGIHSALAVPLFDEGKVLGILYADTSHPLHNYNDDYLRLLATFGNIIASRLLNYALIAERQEKEVINAELKRAESIQDNLMITDPPEIDGYDLSVFLESSRQVGGDLYDVAMLADGCLLFLVADVSGKGLGAAILTSNILAAFRILYTEEQFSLKKAVTTISKQMVKYSSSGDFATLFIGILDPKQHKIKYVNAGHNPPLLVNSKGELKHLETTGMMIGAFDFATWKEESIALEPDDLIFIFTDGVSEAERSDEEQYSDERTEEKIIAARNLKAKEITDVMIADIHKYVGDAPSSDDITMLIIKRET